MQYNMMDAHNSIKISKKANADRNLSAIPALGASPFWGGVGPDQRAVESESSGVSQPLNRRGLRFAPTLRRLAGAFVCLAK